MASSELRVEFNITILRVNSNVFLGMLHVHFQIGTLVSTLFFPFYNQYSSLHKWHNSLHKNIHWQRGSTQLKQCFLIYGHQHHFNVSKPQIFWTFAGRFRSIQCVDHFLIHMIICVKWLNMHVKIVCWNKFCLVPILLYSTPTFKIYETQPKWNRIQYPSLETHHKAMK